ncbi:MAG: STAS domain-containing protein [Phocaeicola sp.]
MNITIKEAGSKTIIELDGRIDTTNAKEFEKAVVDVLSSDKLELEVDCEKLTYISSSGLRIFLVLQKNTNTKKGQLVLKSLNANILEVFRMTGFASIFTIA